MARSTGIVITAAGISFANEYYHTQTPNFRIVFAGLAGALLLDGVERLNETLAVGIAGILMVTVLLTPINGDSPIVTLGKLGGANPQQPKKGK